MDFNSLIKTPRNDSDFNNEFGKYHEQYKKSHPDTSLTDLTTRYGIDPETLSEETIEKSYNEKFTDIGTVAKKMKSDLEKLADDPMENEVWTLAEKYYSDKFSPRDSSQDKRKAIVSTLKLPENNIDALNELKKKLKIKICASKYNNGTKYIIPVMDAIRLPIKEIIGILDDKISGQSNLAEQHYKDIDTYKRISSGDEAGVFMQSLSEYMETVINENLKSKMLSYLVKYVPGDKETGGYPAIDVTESSTSKLIIEIIPSGKPSEDGKLRFDVEVTGIDLPEEDIVTGTKNLVSFLDYKKRHGQNSRQDGGYEMLGISQDDIAEKAISAIFAFHIIQGELDATASSMSAFRTKHHSREDVSGWNAEKKHIEKSMADIGTSKNTSGKKNDGKLKPTAAAIKAKSDLGKVKTREATLSKDLVNRLSASMENFPEGTDDD